MRNGSVNRVWSFFARSTYEFWEDSIVTKGCNFRDVCFITSGDLREYYRIFPMHFNFGNLGAAIILTVRQIG